MRIRDWSSDVCSSDLRRFDGQAQSRRGSVRATAQTKPHCVRNSGGFSPSPDAATTGMAMNIAQGAIPMDKLWQDGAERAADEPALVIDVGGFEGPVDLLLHLARSQQVDLARISVLALADHYL